MKTVTMHSTQTKKSYRKPVLKKIGSVKSITRGGSGGSTDLSFNQKPI
jgi:hypothetical protein